jgi:hypothetical protein
MKACSSCQLGEGKFRGSVCPIASYTPATFATGCAMHRAKVTPKEKPARVVTPGPTTPGESTKKPNFTEEEYRRLHLGGKDARYEAVPFLMANGHRYTPDWVVVVDGIPTECHEVKGGHAMFSQGRAALAFDQCRVEFPHVKWVWATKTKKKGWVIK